MSRMLPIAFFAAALTLTAEQTFVSEPPSIAVLELAAQQSQSNTLGRAQALNRLGMALHDAAAYLEAERAYSQSAAICRKLGDPGLDLLSSALNNLGALRTDLGKLNQAAASLREALLIRERLHGDDRPSLVVVLSNLGGVETALDRLSKADDTYQRALRISRAASGAESLATASLLNNLAALRHRQGRRREAAELFEEVAEIVKDVHGLTRGLALSNLAAVQVELGRYEDAEYAAETALTILERTLPPEHPRLAKILLTYSELMKKTKRSSYARTMKRRAKRILAQSRDDNLLDHSIDVSAFAAPQ